MRSFPPPAAIGVGAFPPGELVRAGRADDARDRRGSGDRTAGEHREHQQADEAGVHGREPTRLPVNQVLA